MTRMWFGESRRLVAVVATLGLVLTAAASTAPARAATLNAPVVGIARTPDGQGYWLVASDGGVFSFGDARFYGSVANVHLNQPVVGIAATPDGRGYWLVAADGGVFTFGDAHFYGSTANVHLNKPVVGIAATPDGKGYWLAAADGGVFNYGDAPFKGSAANVHLNKPVVGIAATPDGQGYWLAAADGGVFNYGDAPFKGSAGNVHLNQPVVGITATPDGKGYWLAAGDGGVFNYGDAPFKGSEGGKTLNRPVVGIARTTDGRGYWLAGGDGGVFALGDAVFHSSLPGLGVNPAPLPALPSPTSSAPPPIPGGAGLSPIRRTIVNAALGQNGYYPPADGCSRYGIDVCGLPWCSVFATWAWEQAGVPIPIYPFSGDPYNWASHNTYTLALGQTPAPGDLVFFGTGPQNTSTSVHVAVITQVYPNGAVSDMNGNGNGDRVGPDYFFPTGNWSAQGEPGPVYGYASPVMDQASAAGAQAASGSTTVTLTVTRAQLIKLLRGQDSAKWQRAQARKYRGRVAAEHLPFVGRRTTIEVASYLHSRKLVLRVLYSGSERAARRDFSSFLRRYHDHGRAYIVRYSRRK
jgi:CHAP domain